MNIIATLVAQGLDPNSEDDARNTPASEMLIHGGHARDILDRESTAESLNMTALHQAVALSTSGSRLTSQMLELHFNVMNDGDTTGMTALHWAALNGDVTSVHNLLRWKADVNLPDNEGTIALHWAAWADHVECILALLEAGSKVNANDQDRRTPLFRASTSLAVDVLVAHGALVTHEDHEGQTPLQHAASVDWPVGATALLRNGASHLARNKNGDTPTSTAIQYDSTDSLAVLIDVHAHSKVGNTLFSTNARLGLCLTEKVIRMARLRCCSALDDWFRADFTSQCSQHWLPNLLGRNALHLAALCTGTKTMYALASGDLRGLDPLAQDEDGDTPDDCFYSWRDSNCTIMRDNVETEEIAWKYLITSACRQNSLGIECQTDDKESDDWQEDNDDRVEDSNDADSVPTDDAFVDAVEHVADVVDEETSSG